MEDFLALFEEYFSQWFLKNGWEWAHAHTKGLVKVIAGAAVSFFAFIGWLATRLFSFWLKKRAASSLLPYLKMAEARKYTKYFVPTRVQSGSPADQLDFKKLLPTEPYLDFFIKKVFQDADDSERFHLVLGGAGMGKTTFLVNLAIRYRMRLLIHFWEPKYRIYYIPLSEKEVIERIKEIQNQPNSILLLDSLDEDPRAHTEATQRIKDLIYAAKNFHTVIITCRTQFFDTVNEEQIKTDIYRDSRYLSFDKMYVAPFSPEEIKKYLRKKYRLNLWKRREAWKIVTDFRDIMARPLILTYIEDLLKGGQQYNFKFQVYDKIITEWMHRESHKPHVSPGEHEVYRTNLRAFSQQIAQIIYQNFKEKDIQYVPEDIFYRLARPKKLTLLPKEMKSRSLLTRNSAAQWKFAHKSIMCSTPHSLDQKRG